MSHHQTQIQNYNLVLEKQILQIEKDRLQIDFLIKLKNFFYLKV